MKNLVKALVLFLFVTSLCAISINAQSVYEYGIKFTDENNATLVGADGVIMRTLDGGNTWFLQNSNTTNVFYCTER